MRLRIVEQHHIEAAGPLSNALPKTEQERPDARAQLRRIHYVMRRHAEVSHYGVQANPTEDDVLEALEVYRERGCDGLIGLGGGSPIDAAKAVRLMATHPGALADYDVTAGGVEKVTANLPPMLAVPTTAGTGSEAGRGTLIQVPRTGRKTAVISPFLLPSVAICDPRVDPRPAPRAHGRHGHGRLHPLRRELPLDD